MMDMIRHIYAKDRVRRQLSNFRKIYFYNSPMEPTIDRYRVHDPVLRDKYWWLVTEGVWRCIEEEGQAPWHGGLLGDEWVRLSALPEF